MKHVDGDAHLIMRKLEFVYLTLSESDYLDQNQQQIDSLKEANAQMMDKIKKNIGKFRILEVNPLSIKERYNMWYGMPSEFVQIYRNCLAKNGLVGSVCSTTFQSSSKSETLFRGSSFLSQWTPSSSISDLSESQL